MLQVTPSTLVHVWIRLRVLAPHRQSTRPSGFASLDFEQWQVHGDQSDGTGQRGSQTRFAVRLKV